MTFMDKRVASCYGCGACADICPVQCITFELDEQGFSYPRVNKQSCISCNLCQKVCPIEFNRFVSMEDVDLLAGRCNDDAMLMASSSGGAFWAIVNYAVQMGGYVWGASFDQQFQLRHTCSDSLLDCEKFRKSKYILSNAGGCYKKIVEQLKHGDFVLFSSTPCQCAALLNYCDATGTPTERLLTVSILCHGAPSQQVFDWHIAQLEEDISDRLLSYEFRAKYPKDGAINSRSAMLKFASGKQKLVDMNTDAYLNGFYNRLFLRRDCGQCKFAGTHRVGDITLGDAWQIEKSVPQWNSLEGVSLIFLNTNKGKQLAEIFAQSMQLREVDWQWAVSVQEILRGPTEMHTNREKFFKLMPKIGFHLASFRCTHRSLLTRALGRLRRMVSK